MQALMRKFILVCLLGTPAFCQVVVSQDFIDTASKAAREAVADRATIAAKNETIAAKDETIAAKDDALKAKDEALLAKDALLKAALDQNKLKDAQIADLSKLKCSKTKFLFGLIGVTRCH